MDYLIKEKKVLEGEAESSDLKDDEVEFFMEKYFKCTDSIDSLEVEYQKYTNGKIPMSSFISFVNSINGKKVSAKAVSGLEVQSNSIKK